MSRDEMPRTQAALSFQERRKKADWIVKMATILSVLSWVVAFTVWILLDMAAPEREHMFTRWFGVTVRGYWDVTLLPMAFGLLVAALCLCFLAFMFNKLRMKRKTDKYRKSVFIIGGITIIGTVVFVIRFGGYFLW
jgi:uncharacterized protein (DUF2062 family)